MRTLILFLIAILCPTFMWGQFNPENPDEPSLQKPTAVFGWVVYNNRVKCELNTLNASRYEWNFGDGTTSKEKNPLHVYSAPGSYTISLTVSNGVGSDMKEETIVISSEENWYLPYQVTLDKEGTGVYNYTSLDELFTDLFKLRFNSNTHTIISVEGSSFELSSAIDLTSRKDELFQKMKDSGYSIEVVGSKSSSTLKLWPTCSKQDFNALMELKEYMTFDNTYITLGDVKVNVSEVDRSFNRTVCPGNSVYIYFNTISYDFSYSWKLKEASPAITGYVESGEGNMSDMVLTNTSENMEILLYEVSFMKGGEVYYTKDCQISVYPVVEEVKLIHPSEDEIVTTPSEILFEWKTVPGATYYNVYYREYVEKEKNDFVYLTGTSNGYINYRGADFKFDKSYEWKVVANTQCGSISSINSKFQISQAPDLQITSFDTDVKTVKPGQTFTISATITNKGTKEISASSWSDKLWEISADDNWTDLGVIAQTNKNLGVDEDYTLEFRVTAPFDDSDILHYQLRVDYLDQVKESDESNNYKDLSIPINTVTIPEEEYNALKSLYTSAKGGNWTLTQKWDISKNTVSRNNWENVTFDNDGHVLAIHLSNKNLSGTIPASLFAMPNLQKLDLSQNHLSGDLETLITSVETANNLEEVNLSYNQLSGTVPNAINQLSKLTVLDLSYNKLHAIEGVLSSNKLTSLNLSNQEIVIDPIRLIKNPSLKLPSICLYDHTAQKLDVYPNFRISSDNISAELRYVDGKYWIFNSTNNIRIPSGQELTITQRNGSAVNSHSSFKVLFEQGDANMDDGVDLLDIQHTLNYIINELESGMYVSFNYSAANTYTDVLINVQDIVSTVNIIMDANPELRSALRAVDTEHSARLSVEDGYLVLDNPLEMVTGMDVVLEGVSCEQIELLLPEDDYMYVARDTEKGVRFILLCMNGEGVRLGKTKVMKVDGTDVAITYAMLSNKAAKEVPVWFEGKKEGEIPTDMEPIEGMNPTDPMLILIPEGMREMRLGLYHVGGRMAWSKRLSGMAPGIYSVRKDLVGLSSGTYILRLEMRTDQDVIVRNIKLFISK